MDTTRRIIGFDPAARADGFPVGMQVLMDVWFFPTDGSHPYIETTLRVEILSVPERVEAPRKYFDENRKLTQVDNPKKDSVYGQWVRLLEPLGKIAPAGTESIVRLSFLRPIT